MPLQNAISSLRALWPQMSQGVPPWRKPWTFSRKTLESASPRRPPLTDCIYFRKPAITSPSGEPNISLAILDLNAASFSCASADLSCSQHLQKLKRKEGNGAPTKKSGTPGKKRGKAPAEVDDDESPKKKRKTPVKAAPGHAAAEHDDDEDVQQQLKNEDG